MEKSNKKFNYGLIGLLFLGWMLGGFDRTVINFAAVPITQELGVSATETGIIISAFFAGYMLMQIPGGMLADKFGARKVLLVVVFVWSIFTGLTGVVTSFYAMIAVRFMFGLGEGPYTPSAGKIISITYVPEERGKATSLMLSSQGVVAILAPILAAYMITAFGWRNLFIAIGCAGILIVLLFYKFLKKDVDQVSPAVAPEKNVAPAKKLSYRKVFRIPMIRNLLIANFATYTLIWGLGSWMPSYLIKSYGVDLTSAGWLQSIPGLGSFVSIVISGFVIDRLSDGTNKTIVTVSAAFCSVALFVMYRGGLSVGVLISLQTVIALVTGYLAIYMPTLVYKKIPGNIVGSTCGTTNFAAQAGSFFAPVIMGIITDASGGNIGSSFWFLLAMGVVLTLAIGTMKCDVTKYVEENSCI